MSICRPGDWCLISGLDLHLQQTRSNASHVLLTSVVAANSGRYGCEASADAPSFHTQIQFKEMTVVGELITVFLFHFGIFIENHQAHALGTLQGELFVGDLIMMLYSLFIRIL